MKAIELIKLGTRFDILRFPPQTAVPHTVFKQEIYFVGKTPEELSIVLPAGAGLTSEQISRDWTCFKVAGPLDFSLTGIIAGLASVLAEVGISVFTIATFDTDYLLVRTSRADSAVKAFEQAGYRIS